MRHGRHILDCGDIQTGCLQAADGRFATGARPLDPHFHFLEAVRLRIAGSTLGHLRRGVGRALREPLNPARPALNQLIGLPCISVMVTRVLLKVARMCAIPCVTFSTSWP